MTNIFGFHFEKGSNVDVDKFDGAEFIVKEVSAQTSEKLDSINESTDEHSKKMNLPLPLALLKYLALFAGMITVVSVLRAEVTVSEAFSNAPYVFYIGGIGWIIYAILQLTEWLKKKKHIASDSFAEYLEKAENHAAASKQELGIPQNAPCVDVFCFAYKYNKKDEQVQAKSDFKYLPLELFIFQDEQKLYLADLTTVFAFDKKDCVNIEKIENRTTFKGWNKEEAINSAKYKKYKLTANQYGTVFCKYYYSLQISSNSKLYEILIPPYEIATFASIIGKTYKE